jgi:dTDP-N-acetylfucosamine:lipid II N-acetylfucosaminyltransferase
VELKKIINIMRDDKFLDYYIKMSEIFIPAESTYIVFSDSSSLKYIKSNNINLIVLPANQDTFNQVICAAGQSKAIVFHSFKEDLYPFVKMIPSFMKKIWVFWGFEGYGAIGKRKFIANKSNFARYESSAKGIARYIYHRYKDFFASQQNTLSIDIIKEMDFCATWVEADHKLAKQINPGISSLHFNYYVNELMGLDEVEVEPLNPKQLLLGNSGDPTNNHFEALEYLHSIQYGGIIICPVSYGGSPVYVNKLCNYGNKLFGSRFKPLKTFMPLNEYQTIVNNCGVMWMNHTRQQAAGNLLMSFISQKVVVTDERNPLNYTFENWGLSFFRPKALVHDLNEFGELLEKNRKIVLKKLEISENAEYFATLSSFLTNDFVVGTR